MAALSPAQLLGYLAFAMGVAAFLQRNDRRLKLLLAVESLVYAAHFLLLGNPTAAGSALVTAGRSALASRWRSRRLAAVAVVVYVVMGLVLARGPAGWLPVIAGCLGSIALFTLHGVRMRLVLLVCTALWLANNLLSGSIGGTLLETFIAAASIVTLVRLVRAERCPITARSACTGSAGASPPPRPAAASCRPRTPGSCR